MKSLLWFLIFTAFFYKAFGQDSTLPETKTAIKFGEFSRLADWNDRQTDEFLAEYFDSANRFTNSDAIVILSGSFDNLVSRRLQIVRKAYSHKFETIRLRFKVVKSDTATTTDFWIVPVNAAAPSVETEAWKEFSLEEVIDSETEKRFRDFLAKAFDLRGEVQYYFISYGPPAFIARRERFLRDALGRTPEFPDPRITFVNGGTTQPSSTHIWLAPAGAKLPTP